MKIGDHVVIIGGYEDCSDTWEMLVVADQRLVDMAAKMPGGEDISCDDEESWLSKLPKFTLPAVVDATYYVWLE